MPDYDSDTSSDAGDDIATNVTLGYASTEPTGDDVSRIGGHPVWLDNNTPPPASLAKCKVCNSYMSLLLSLHADLHERFPGDERRLHVWCCRKKQCSRKQGSIRAFREVKKAKTSANARRKEQQPTSQEKAPEQPKQDLGSQLFGASPSHSQTASNPFSSSPLTNGATNPFSSLAALPPQTPQPSTSPQPPTETFASKLSISASKPTSSPSPTDPWPSPTAFPTPFPPFHLDAEAEYLESSPPSNGEPSTSRATYEDASAPTLSDRDAYESSHDRTFQLFSERIAQNPTQVLRYDFCGTPLLYSSAPADDVARRFHVPHGTKGAPLGMPRCEACAGARVFEMQLVPGLIYEVEKDDERAMSLEGGEGMVWGTVVVGVCAKNCGEEGSVAFREEWVGVQWEESVVAKKMAK